MNPLNVNEHRTSLKAAHASCRTWQVDFHTGLRHLKILIVAQELPNLLVRLEIVLWRLAI